VHEIRWDKSLGLVIRRAYYHPRVFGIDVRGYCIEKPVFVADFVVVNPGRFATQIAQHFGAYTISSDVAVDRQYESQRSTPKHGRVIWVFVEILKIEQQKNSKLTLFKYDYYGSEINRD